MRQMDVAVGIHRVEWFTQVLQGGFVVDAGREEAALVVLAGIFGGRAEDVEVADAAHVDLATVAERLAHIDSLLHPGDAAAEDIDPADVGGAPADPVGAGEDVPVQDFRRADGDVEGAAEALVGVDALFRHRVLVPVVVAFLQLASDLEGFLVDVVGAPGVVHEDHVVPDRVGHRVDEFDVVPDV